MHSKIRHLINSAPHTVSEMLPILEAMRVMVGENADFALATDQHGYISGILTRSDLLCGIALDAEKPSIERSSLLRPVADIMASPVEFVRFDRLNQDLVHACTRLRLSHFPVIRGGCPPTVRNLVGTLTVSAIGQGYLEQEF